jgi:hypothetical protein
VDHIRCIGSTRSFVTFGANQGMPLPWIHAGVVVFYAGDGFLAVALAASDSAPHLVKAPCLAGVALDAGSPFVKLEPPPQWESAM